MPWQLLGVAFSSPMFRFEEGSQGIRKLVQDALSNHHPTRSGSGLVSKLLHPRSQVAVDYLIRAPESRWRTRFPAVSSLLLTNAGGPMHVCAAGHESKPEGLQKRRQTFCTTGLSTCSGSPRSSCS